MNWCTIPHYGLNFVIGTPQEECVLHVAIHRFSSENINFVATAPYDGTAEVK